MSKFTIDFESEMFPNPISSQYQLNTLLTYLTAFSHNPLAFQADNKQPER